MLAQKAGPAVLIEFQELYADLLGIDRLSSGRYPERREQDAYALGITEYLRRAAISAARDREIDAIVTNSDGDPERRQNTTRIHRARRFGRGDRPWGRRSTV